MSLLINLSHFIDSTRYLHIQSALSVKLSGLLPDAWNYCHIIILLCPTSSHVIGICEHSLVNYSLFYILPPLLHCLIVYPGTIWGFFFFFSPWTTLSCAYWVNHRNHLFGQYFHCVIGTHLDGIWNKMPGLWFKCPIIYYLMNIHWFLTTMVWNWEQGTVCWGHILLSVLSACRLKLLQMVHFCRVNTCTWALSNENYDYHSDTSRDQNALHRMCRTVEPR